MGDVVPLFAPVTCGAGGCRGRTMAGVAGRCPRPFRCPLKAAVAARERGKQESAPDSAGFREGAGCGSTDTSGADRSRGHGPRSGVNVHVREPVSEAGGRTRPPEDVTAGRDRHPFDHRPWRPFEDRKLAALLRSGQSYMAVLAEARGLAAAWGRDFTDVAARLHGLANGAATAPPPGRNDDAERGPGGPGGAA